MNRIKDNRQNLIAFEVNMNYGRRSHRHCQRLPLSGNTNLISACGFTLNNLDLEKNLQAWVTLVCFESWPDPNH